MEQRGKNTDFSEITNDKMKNMKCKEWGIKLIRVRENALPPLEESVCIKRKDDSIQSLTDCILELFQQLHICYDVNVERDIIKITERYRTAFLENRL